jgi:hypothetical protein
VPSVEAVRAEGDEGSTTAPRGPFRRGDGGHGSHIASERDAGA